MNFYHNLEELPKNIKKLINLRHLNFYGCGINYSAIQIEKLSSLEKLDAFVAIKSGSSTAEQDKLHNN